ncbi:ABC transporter ATP-binding protein [Halegenticoccus soli]|uniref:ABC transporter ATP-binding protein n=1 Tax=Halegenticoccus soli TaxID=1985678 RepID=UPI000C6D4D42|nr:sn-glycerol-3-phosphate ABC transporter ATP-binding protein UgpC [Halegenticoccus soli]
MGELQLNGLRKVFGDGGNAIVAVNDLDLTIDDGEFLVLVGPSGCGKSTTLRCIAGLESVSDGEILLDGDPIARKRPRDRDMAMVFQNYALYPHMTVRKNLGYGLKIMTDLSKSAIDERVEETAEMLEISELLDKKPKALSGGQQQRVALGRAIIREPEVFLMDEPLSNLDAKLRTTMRTEIQRLQSDLGVTTVYVTHDQTEAMTMGDRIAVLDGGELQQVGTPLECYHAPANRFVAGFIGSPSMNFLNVERRDRTLLHEAFSYELPGDFLPESEAAGDEMVLGVRPEHIELTDGDERNAVRVRVDVVEPMGEHSYVYFRLGGETYTASVSGDVILRQGDEVSVNFPVDRIHLFDARTGAAVKNSAVAERTVGADADRSRTLSSS